MGSRTAPLLVLAVLTAAALFWWASSTDGERSGDVARAEARDEAGPRGVSAELAPAKAAEQDERRAQETRVATEAAPLFEEAPGLDPVARPTGTARLRGTVTDREGTPVEGAEVTLRHAEFLGAPTLVTLPEPTRTDADGRFAFRGLPGQSLRVEVRAAGFAPSLVPVGLGAGDDLELDPILLTRGAILSGRVVDPSGVGVEGAELFRLEAGAGALFGGPIGGPIGGADTVTEADGSFRLDHVPLGDWRVLVRDRRHPDALFEGLAEVAGEELTGQLFELEPGATIRGRVTGVPEDLEDELVVVAIKAGSDWLDWQDNRTASPDAAGRFEVEGLVPDSDYHLGLHVPRSESTRLLGASRSAIVAARSGDSGIVLPYQREAALVFQVFDADTREPIEEFEVEAGAEWLDTLQDEQRRAIREHPEGRVRFGNLRPHTAGERFTLVVRANGYADYRREGIALATGQEYDLGAVYLEPIPRVLVTVVDATTREPVEDALVTLDREVTGHVGNERKLSIEAEIGPDGRQRLLTGDVRGRTDERGFAALSSLQGELVTLRVQSETHATWMQEGLTLPRGDSYEVEVALTRGGVVTVTTVDPYGELVGRVQIEHEGPNDPWMPRIPGLGAAPEVTDSSGTLRLERMAPGTHRFRIAEDAGGIVRGGSFAFAVAGDEDADDDSWTLLEVEEGGEHEVTLETAPRGTLVGRVTEEGRALVGATVKLEDAKSDMSFSLPGMDGGDGPSARTDGTGEFELNGIEEGDYTLVVRHATREMADRYDVKIVAGTNEFDVDLPLSILEGRVLDESGAPLAGIRVRAEVVEQEESATGFIIMVDGAGGHGGGMITSEDLLGEPQTTDAEGRFRLRGVTPDKELVVVASGASVQEKRSDPVVVPAGDVVDGVEIVALEAGSLDIAVFDALGEPKGYQMVRATYEGEGEADPSMGFTTADGRTELEGLRPGPWRLSISTPSPGEEQDPPHEEVVEVVAGQSLYTPIELQE